MPCNKRPLVKKWVRPRSLRVVKSSRYEKIDPATKVHWRNVINDLEEEFKDSKFWDTNWSYVKDLVTPAVLAQLVRIFSLSMAPHEAPYAPVSELDPGSQQDSEVYYTDQAPPEDPLQPVYSISHCSLYLDKKESEDEGLSKGLVSEWSVESFLSPPGGRISRSATHQSLRSLRSRSNALMKSYSRINKSLTQPRNLKDTTMTQSSKEDVDFDIHTKSRVKVKSSCVDVRKTGVSNPHHALLYGCRSEAEMIKWKSKYIKSKWIKADTPRNDGSSDPFGKTVQMEKSHSPQSSSTDSDPIKSKLKSTTLKSKSKCKPKTYLKRESLELHENVEQVAKQIAADFFEWWNNLGESKSQIKYEEDVRTLFMIWFDEQSSRCMVKDPKILPCVLDTIASYEGVLQSSCYTTLQCMLASDIKEERLPERKVAFNSTLPPHLTYIPPKNDTKEAWRDTHIPEDLSSMSCVWGDITHLTSTKSYLKWLKKEQLPIPAVLKDLDSNVVKKTRYTLPSNPSFQKSSRERVVAPPLSNAFPLEVDQVIGKLLEDFD